MKKLLIEYLGTFFITGAFLLNFDLLSLTSMFIAWIFIGAAVSGAHYNPIISLAVGLKDKTCLYQMSSYILAQISGALMAYTLIGLYEARSVMPIRPMPAAGTEFSSLLISAGLGEMLASFMLILAFLTITHVYGSRQNHTIGLSLGFIFPAVIMFAQSPCNPAISIASWIASFIFNKEALLMAENVMGSPWYTMIIIIGTYLIAALAGMWFALWTQGCCSGAENSDHSCA